MNTKQTTTETLISDFEESMSHCDECGGGLDDISRDRLREIIDRVARDTWEKADDALERSMMKVTGLAGGEGTLTVTVAPHEESFTAISVVDSDCIKRAAKKYCQPLTESV